jgi:hypothetical protein
MIRRCLLSALLAAAAVTQIHAAAAATFTPPPFPRLGGVLIGSPFNYDDAQYASQIARLDLAILSVWPGWTGSNGMSVQQAVSAIKSRNPNEIITLYMNIMELQQPVNAAWTPVQTQLNNNGWWLYASGPSGSHVSSGTGYGYEINTTAFTTPNSSGQRYIDWRAAWQVQTFATPNPAVDGFYTDNVFWKPRVDGDWNRDGTSDSQNNATVQAWWRQGYVDYFNDLKAQMPGKYQLGNVADWGQSNAVLAELSGQLQGGVMEGMIGYSWSFESLGWQSMMAAYRKIMAAIGAPQLVIFHQDGSPTDYQGFRYGFTSCLMDNAYYYYSSGNYSGVNWFDEFNSSLGQATSSPPTSAWQNGVYRRDFQNGIALVNPKGNGAQTVTLETTYKHLSGTQASSVNNGQSVTSVTLKDRDGVILLRTTAQSVPDAPTLTVQ